MFMNKCEKGFNPIEGNQKRGYDEMVYWICVVSVPSRLGGDADLGSG